MGKIFPFDLGWISDEFDVNKITIKAKHNPKHKVCKKPSTIQKHSAIVTSECTRQTLNEFICEYSRICVCVRVCICFLCTTCGYFQHFIFELNWIFFFINCRLCSFHHSEMRYWALYLLSTHTHIHITCSWANYIHIFISISHFFFPHMDHSYSSHTAKRNVQRVYLSSDENPFMSV